MKKHKLENHFIVLYSGNQGRCHDLNTLLNAAKILKNKKDILFLFVGDGFQNKSLKKDCFNNNVENCMFLPFQEKHHLLNHHYYNYYFHPPKDQYHLLNILHQQSNHNEMILV